MKKKVTVTITAIITIMTLMFNLTACGAVSSRKEDTKNTLEIANKLQEAQPTPTDINYSLERYNLIRRTYWVNGMREKAVSLPCQVKKPVGYIVLFNGNAVVGSFTVDGKVSSLNSFLTPDSEFYEQKNNDTNGLYVSNNEWLADVDGSYGENDNGIFFFTTDGKYVEWTGEYLYSDIPMKIEKPVVEFEVTK